MQFSMFAEETQLERLSKLGDSFEKLKIIDFEAFRPVLENAFRKERKSNADSAYVGKEIPDHVENRACEI